MHQLVAEFFDVGESSEVVTVVTAHFQDSQHISFPLNRAIQMLTEGLHALFDGWRFQVQAGFQKIFYFVKDILSRRR